jgi:hypothetical protein
VEMNDGVWMWITLLMLYTKSNELSLTKAIEADSVQACNCANLA